MRGTDVVTCATVAAQCSHWHIYEMTKESKCDRNKSGVAKLRPADQFNPACQTPRTRGVILFL